MLGKLNFYYMGIDSWSGEKFKIKLDLSEKDENGNYRIKNLYKANFFVYLQKHIF